jgi:hypothetical protein
LEQKSRNDTIIRCGSRVGRVFILAYNAHIGVSLKPCDPRIVLVAFGGDPYWCVGVRSYLLKGLPLIVLHACTMSLGRANTNCYCYQTVSDELSCDVAMPTRDCAQQLHDHQPLNNIVKVARMVKIEELVYGEVLQWLI